MIFLASTCHRFMQARILHIFMHYRQHVAADTKIKTDTRNNLMGTIEWQTSVGHAIDSAKTTRKPILLDFYNPE